jgi:hypothetical protein
MTTDFYTRALGLSLEEMQAQFNYRVEQGEDPLMIAASILSDAQELIDVRDKTRTKQAINRAKWVLFELQDSKRETEA